MNHPATAPENAMKAMSSAMKLILCPPAGRPVLSAPEGYKVNAYGVDNANATIWVVNMTETPPSVQGVRHETGSVIVNGVPQAIAEATLGIYEVHGIDAAIEVLVLLGYKDQYTTDFNFIKTKLSPAGTMLDNNTGVVKRDDRDVMPVWQEADGRFYVLNNMVPHLIQPDLLQCDYRNTDGSKIDLDQVPLAVRDDEAMAA